MSRLWVPQAYAEDRLMVCRTPTKDGPCMKVFHAGEERAWQRHVAQCARENIDHIKAASLRTRLPFLDPESWDTEIAAHMKKVGEQMKREGRLEVKPNERAGFS